MSPAGTGSGSAVVWAKKSVADTDCSSCQVWKDSRDEEGADSPQHTARLQRHPALQISSPTFMWTVGKADAPYRGTWSLRKVGMGSNGAEGKKSDADLDGYRSVADMRLGGFRDVGRLNGRSSHDECGGLCDVRGAAHSGSDSDTCRLPHCPRKGLPLRIFKRLEMCCRREMCTSSVEAVGWEEGGVVEKIRKAIHVRRFDLILRHDIKPWL